MDDIRGPVPDGTHTVAIDRLRADHQQVLARLSALEGTLSRVSAVPDKDAASELRAFLDFITHEVWSHFGAEEEALFPFLHNLFPAENAPVVGGPVYVLTEEHGVLRRLVARLGENVQAWEREASEAKADAVRLVGGQTVRAFQKHIYKEDNIVFRLAENTLSEDEKERLNAAFERVLSA